MKRRGRGELKEILFNQAKGKIGYEKPHWRKMKEGRVEEHFRMGASQEMLFMSYRKNARV